MRLNCTAHAARKHRASRAGAPETSGQRSRRPSVGGHRTESLSCIELDLRIAIHNHVYSTRFNYVDQVLAAVEGRDGRVGALVDTGHYAKLEENPAEAIRRLGDRVLGVHLKDVDGLGIDAHDAILGEGIIDLADVFRALREVRFREDASLSLEYETHEDAPFDDLALALDNAAVAAHASRR